AVRTIARGPTLMRSNNEQANVRPHMGRKRKHNREMPRYVYWSHGQWFFAEKATKKWIALGADRADALREYGRLVEGKATGTMVEGFARYRRDVLPKKAPKTQREQLRQFERLASVFGRVPPASLSAGDVGQYLDRHPNPVSANREIALLS